ncbi:MAG: hypothetical protein Q9204_007805 [Flavoplaca sp. TL-2023a]
MAAIRGMVDPKIFEQLQADIDDDSNVREEIRNFLQKRERQAFGVVKEALGSAQSSIDEQVNTIRDLGSVASKYPYYKYHHMWSRHTQDTILALIFSVWLGVYGEHEQGTLLTINDVASYMNGKPIETATSIFNVQPLAVPVNVKDRDVFHITTEEYLLALTDLTEELARLAVNSVTLGDYQRPLQISKFVKDLHAGFQILNLKNDILRRKSDAIKYNIKKTEDVVYDLSLRNLIPRNAS